MKRRSEVVQLKQVVKVVVKVVSMVSGRHESSLPFSSPCVEG